MHALTDTNSLRGHIGVVLSNERSLHHCIPWRKWQLSRDVIELLELKYLQAHQESSTESANRRNALDAGGPPLAKTGRHEQGTSDTQRLEASDPMKCFRVSDGQRPGVTGRHEWRPFIAMFRGVNRPSASRPVRRAIRAAAHVFIRWSYLRLVYHTATTVSWLSSAIYQLGTDGDYL